MSDVPREAAESVMTTVRRAFVFSGRATRRDVIYYWLFTGLVTLAANVAVDALLVWDAAVFAGLGLDVLLSLPFFALFARRLHDQDRSGWWVLMLPPLMAFHAYETLHVNFAVLDPNWPENASHPERWGWLLFPLAVASVVFMFMPGTIGLNRHGPDPREDDEVRSAG